VGCCGQKDLPHQTIEPSRSRCRIYASRLEKNWHSFGRRIGSACESKVYYFLLGSGDFHAILDWIAVATLGRIAQAGETHNLVRSFYVVAVPLA
jgi:hypothetical protein